VPTIPYVRQTWADTAGGGTPTSAARFNVQEAGINDVSYAPAVRVYHNATQSLTSATETALAFNTEVYDQAGNAVDTMHDTATNNSRLTCRYAGIYHVTGNIQFAGNATGSRTLFLRVNGTASQYLGYVAIAASATVPQALHVSSDLNLAVNDYVQLFAYQDSGGALNVNAGTALAPFSCEFMMHRVG
jgi:hypothetical protein